MQKNEEVILDIVGMTAEGSGVGRREGLAVFVPQTAIGDRVRAKLVKVKSSYAFARLEEVLVPSSDRTENDCPVFRQCGGCVYRHIRYEAECRIKQDRVRETMKRIGGVGLPPKPLLTDGQIAHYRNKVQLPCAAGGAVGFYAVHSHRIVPCGHCALQPPVFDRMIAAFSRWVEENGVSVYDERARRGLLRHLYLRLAEATGELMVTVVANGQTLPESGRLIEALRAAGGDALKSIQLNTNRKDTNVILGERCQVLYGQSTITDVLCGLKIRLSAFSFYQVNRGMAERLYRKAAEYARPEGKILLDLYCGAGTIGLSMADRAKRVIGVEIVPQAVEDAIWNAQQNGITNAEFLCADAKQAAIQLAERGIRPDVVLVDPPRKGCSSELVETVALRFAPERVVYVSCDPATLARDVSLFTGAGYTVAEYTPVDLFPRTAHVETVVLLSRK